MIGIIIPIYRWENTEVRTASKVVLLEFNLCLLTLILNQCPNDGGKYSLFTYKLLFQCSITDLKQQTNKKTTPSYMQLLLPNFGSYLSLVLSLLSHPHSPSPSESTFVDVCRRFSHLQLFVTPWTVAHQVPLSMGFSRQECWSEWPFSPPRGSSWLGDLTPASCFSCIAGRLFTTKLPCVKGLPRWQ